MREYLQFYIDGRWVDSVAPRTLAVENPATQSTCGRISPWNWPLNQIAAKVIPTLATGCTMVLKPGRCPLPGLGGDIPRESCRSSGGRQ